MKNKVVILMVFLFMAAVPQALATPLNHWAFNIDGTLTESGTMPVSGSLDAVTGMGTLTWSTTAAVTHSFLAFFDYDIDETVNTNYNETGQVFGAAVAGQSWEIDSPAWNDSINDIGTGDIHDHVINNTFLNNTLDKSPTTGGITPIGDVSMAMGWNFSLTAGEVARITLNLVDSLPQSAPSFYLEQRDPDSASSIFFFGELAITPVPEPGTLFLTGVGMLMFSGLSRKKQSGAS